MKSLAGLLFVTILWQADAADPLKCRRCIGANSLDDCTFSVPCPNGEICYMDEVITESLTIEFNGGCRPRDVCIRRPGFAGKRANGPVTACSKCCDTDRKPECNTKLCGIKSSQSNLQQCYHCESKAGAGGAGVKDPNACTNLVSCQSDEYCSADTYRLSTNVEYEFSCITKGICEILTREALYRKDECVKDPVNACPNVTAAPTTAGRRETSGFRVCTACCGDSQCNGDSCEAVIDRLYNLWINNVLDISTLKSNGTIPTTTTAAVPAPAGVTVSG
jgi:hypothetical protein